MENPTTVTTKFVRPSCGMPGEASPALGVCTGCQSAAADRVRTELEAEGMPTETWLLTDAGLSAEAGAPGRPELATRLPVLEDIEERARHRGRRAWLLAGEVTFLTSQVREVREELQQAGYWRLAADEVEALQIALGDAADAGRARELLDADDSLAGAATLADGLQEGLEAITELEEITAILDEHELMDCYQPLPELVRDLAAAAVQIEQVRAVLGERGLLDSDSDLVTVVHAAGPLAVQRAKRRSHRAP